MATHSGNRRPQNRTLDLSRADFADVDEIVVDDELIEVVDDDDEYEDEKTRVFQAPAAAPDDDDDDEYEDEKTQVFQASHPAPAPVPTARPSMVSSSRKAAPAAAKPRTTGARGPAAPARAPQPTPSNDGFDPESTVIIDPAQAPGAQRLAPRPQSIPVPVAASGGQNRGLIALVAFLALALVGVVVWALLGGERGGGADATLALRTSPAGATVYLNGEPWIPPGLQTPATTPTTLGGLAARQPHRVELRLNGYESAELTVSLEPRQVLSRELSLTALPARLEVVTQPSGAAIALNGQPRGESPLTLDDLDSTTLYTVTVTKPGFETRVQSVRFDEGDSRQERIVLTLVPEASAEIAEVEPEPEPTPEPPRAAATARAPAPAPAPRPSPTPTPTTQRTQQQAAPTSVPVAPSRQTAPSAPRDPRDLVASRAAQQQAPAPSPTPAAPRTRPSDRAQAPAAAGSGTISVNARPYGAVWINGRQVASETPLLNHSLPVGRHQVRVFFTELRQFSDERTVEVRAGEETRVSFRGP